MKALNCRQKFDLGGMWKFRVPGGEYTTRRVPGSYPLCGVSEYTRSFTWNAQPDKRVFLCTEGISYEGTLIVNGTEVGKTLPYCHESFDITDLLTENNELTVVVKDISVPFGVMAGWCCYSGIIRAIYLEVRAESYIEDVWFRHTLTDDLTHADATIAVELAGKQEKDTRVVAELWFKDKLVATAQGLENLAFSVEKPELWSPDSPTLYDLCVSLEVGGVTVDNWNVEVGFRSFKMHKNLFYLNGKKFFLKGICRHDLGTAEEGQTLSDEAIEKDFRMIKDLGANFVRLVHYPHDERVVQLANRMGLMISEEPGLWWSNMKNEDIVRPALEVLKKTIIRDRSLPCVAFWMSFNECVFTQEFLNEAVELSRKYDPDRYASGANCMTVDMTKQMFDIANIDFYTQHPYGTDPGHVSGREKRSTTLDDLFDSYADKPLIFTEWGGWYVVDNPELFRRFCEKMKEGFRRDRLAGMCYWMFADMYEYNRNTACIEGLQYEGLVTIHREPKVDYYVMQKFYRELDQDPAQPMAQVAHPECGGDVTESCAISLAGLNEGEAQAENWAVATEESRTLNSHIITSRLKRYITYGPQLPFACEAVGNLKFDALQKPVVIGDKAPECDFKVGKSGKQLVLLGNVVYSLGHPIYGEIGDVYATMTLKYADGSVQEMPLRNGIELLTVMTTYTSSKIDPISPVLKNAVTFSYDKNYENYRIYTLAVDLKSDTVLESVSIKSVSEQKHILLYGASLI